MQTTYSWTKEACGLLSRAGCVLVLMLIVYVVFPSMQVLAWCPRVEKSWSVAATGHLEYL